MNRARTILYIGTAVILGWLFVGFGSTPVTAHGGGLDAYGGHRDTKMGNYHVHQGNCAGRTFASKADAIQAGCKR